jgi:hypothetical protein
MKTRWFLTAFLVIFGMIPRLAPCGTTAQARVFCLGFWFGRGQEDGGLYSLDLTTLNFGVNNELATDFFSPSYTHSTYLQMNDELFGGYLDGWLEVNIPAATDVNANGYNDFFETAQAASGSSSGIFSVPMLGSGTVQASWSRPAGSHLGTCVLRLRFNQFQSYTFRHQFMLYEFTGPVSYTPGATNVSAWLDLSQSGVPDRKLGGLAEFRKSASDRFNLLTLQSGTWTNSDAQVLSFLANDLTRSSTHPTNYFSYLDFTDGDPNTSDPDYLNWALVIEDSNDKDGDQIPDFSDDPGGSTPPRRPVLWLSSTPGSLRLTISGDKGRVHEILESASPDFLSCQTNQTVTLSADPQELLLPLSANGAKFFRVRAW